MSAPLAFLDTETTGLDADRHEIWEVGLIVDSTEYLWQLPVDLGRAEPTALKIGQFHERRWSRKPSLGDGSGPASAAVQGYGWLTPLEDFARHFAELTRGRHLVGAVISFDEERLRKLLKANGACPEWHYHIIDVEPLAAGCLTGQFTAIQEVGADGPTEKEAREATPPWDSNALSMAVGVDPDEFDRHTALGDARWAKAIYEAVLGR